MSSEETSEPRPKRQRRILIISGDESIINEIQRNKNISLCKSVILDTMDEDEPIPPTVVTTEKKTKNQKLTCAVCQSPAAGFNFDVISCESCKSFFRRNALKQPPPVCSRQGNCDITLELRRACSGCRLKKCFERGMHRDRILMAEHKAETRRVKRNQSDPNEQIPALSTPLTSENLSDILDQELFLFSECLQEKSLVSPRALLSAEDLQRLESIQDLYQRRIELARDGLPWNPSVHAMTFLQRINSHSVPLVRLLTFFKQIPEFQQLNVDDRVTLIKFNLLPLLCINSTLSYNSEADTIAETESDSPWDSAILQSVYGVDGYQQIRSIFDKFLHIAKYDQKIIQLALITFILTKGFSGAADIEPVLNDGLAVYRAQNYYAELLWKYLETVHGGRLATEIFTKLITHFMTWQMFQVNIRKYIEQCLSSTDTNELVPFMRALLRL